MSEALTALDSEREVVGACALAGSIADAGVLGPEAFADLRTRGIWEAMASLVVKQAPIDLVTIAAEVVALGRTAWFGSGVDVGIAEVVGGCMALGNLAYHADRVRSKAERRRWSTVLRELAAMSTGDTDDAEFMSEAERRVMDLVTANDPGKGPEHVKSVMRKVTVLLAERVTQFASGKVAGVATGYRDLDVLVGGMVGGRLYVLASRPAMGKSALALEISRRSKCPTLVFGLEMTAEEMGLRLVSATGRIDSRHLETGDMGTGAASVHNWRAVTGAQGELVEAPMWFEDCSDLGIGDMRSIARRWRTARAPVGDALVIVDYLQLVGGTNHGKRDNREQEVAEVARQLKAMAKELDTPVLALAQLNRELERREDKRPKLSDLRESGAVEQDANVVMFLYRDEVYCVRCQARDRDSPCNADHAGVAEVIIAKNRHGPTATAKLTWLPQYTAFETLSKREGDFS